MLDSHAVLTLVEPVWLCHAPLAVHFIVKKVAFEVSPIRKGYFAFSAFFTVHELTSVNATVRAGQSAEAVKL
jgi:hypothetical protein